MTRIDNQTKTFTLSFNLSLLPKKARTDKFWATLLREQLIKQTNLQLSQEWYLVKGEATEKLGQINLVWEVRY